jgi:hypothetical protein
MTFLVADPEPSTSAEAAQTRSEDSLAFELLWRELPREDKPIPYRDAFRPSQAMRFLRDILISDIVEPERGPRIRFCGERLHALTGRNLAGDHLFDLLPPEHHAGVHVSAKIMMEQPCGLWQLSPLHLDRGYAVNLESTIFPMWSRDGHPQFLNLLRPLSGIDARSLDTPRGVAIDTATVFQFLDVGYGLPTWQQPSAA